MIKVGVILSGCGVQDGSEIYEAVLTLLAIEKNGAQAIALAPDVNQSEVVNHYNGQETRLETRHVLAESARIVRGKIKSLGEVSAHDIDALILVGGFGAAKNLCTYATDGIEATVNPDVQRLVSEVHGLRKPIGAMCIAPIVVALALRGSEGGSPLTVTIGSDGNSVVHLQQLGARHQITEVDQICIDAANNITSTAAFMLAETPGEAETGINKLVATVVGNAKQIESTYQGR